MTHTSDVGYMHRATGNTWVLLFMMQHIFRYDRFGALHYKRLMKFELRSLVTIFLFFGILLQVIYDYGILEIKYQVGFFAVPGVAPGVPTTTLILGTPFQFWTEDQRERALVLNYFLAMALACDSCMLFMLQAFWSYITRSIARTDFMSSVEYKLTLTWSAMVMGLFPLMQWLYRDNPVARELAPQLGFAVNDVILASMGVRSHFRFNALIKAVRQTNNDNSRTVIAKLEYYQFMNKLLALGLFGSAFTLGSICVDGLLTVPYINTHKWASDFLITQVNIFEPVMFMSILMILYPRKTSSHANFGDTSRGSKGSTVAVTKAAHASQVNNNSNENKYIRQDDSYQNRPVISNNHGGAIPLESFNNNGSGGHRSNVGRPSHDQYNSQRRPSNSYNNTITNSRTGSDSIANQSTRSKDFKVPITYESYEPNHDNFVQTFSDTDHLTDMKHSSALMAANGGMPGSGNNSNNINTNYQISSNNINNHPSITIPRAQSPPIGLPISPRQQFGGNILAPASPPPIGNGQYTLDDAMMGHNNNNNNNNYHQPGTLSLSPNQTQRQQQQQHHQQQQQYHSNNGGNAYYQS